jgi:hypothetical protein
MIKFFRKIRQKLLSKNKAGKYFLYAIGEIVLIIIGILIALSLNERKQNEENTDLRKLYTIQLIDEVESNINILSDIRDITE